MNQNEVINALSALAQATRLAAFRLLVQTGPEGLPAIKIAEKLGLQPAHLSFHLKELLHANLLVSRQEGRFVFYSVNLSKMNTLLGFLTENCCSGAPCSSATDASDCDESFKTRKYQSKAENIQLNK